MAGDEAGLSSSSEASDCEADELWTWMQVWMYHWVTSPLECSMSQVSVSVEFTFSVEVGEPCDLSQMHSSRWPWRRA